MKEICLRDAITEALREEMVRDETIFVIGEDIRFFLAVTTGLWEQFGDERVFETPISESGFVGAAVGAAAAGMRPVIEFRSSDFMLVAMDSFCNQGAKWKYAAGGSIKKVPFVTIANQGGVGAGIHHSQSLESTFMQFPGLYIAVPTTPYDAKGLMKSALRGNTPVIYFVHRRLMGRGTRGVIPDGDFTVPFGKAKIRREGEDI